MSETILRAENVSKAFQGVKALDRVELTLRQGQVRALMGENRHPENPRSSRFSPAFTFPTAAASSWMAAPFLPVRLVKPRRRASALSIRKLNLVPTLSIADNILLGRQPKRAGFLRKRAR